MSEREPEPHTKIIALCNGIYKDEPAVASGMYRMSGALYVDIPAMEIDGASTRSTAERAQIEYKDIIAWMSWEDEE